jgi:hypothetical protein
MRMADKRASAGAGAEGGVMEAVVELMPRA